MLLFKWGESMNRLFIDTNVFENIGYNFDLKNPIIKSLIRNAKSGEYKYYSLSVIDNEIVNHITDRCSKEYNNVRKIKWIKKYLDDEKIKENCYKDLNDYNQFKKRINSLACDVSSINPEIIFEKYFKVEYGTIPASNQTSPTCSILSTSLPHLGHLI